MNIIELIAGGAGCFALGVGVGLAYNRARINELTRRIEELHARTKHLARVTKAGNERSFAPTGLGPIADAEIATRCGKLNLEQMQRDAERNAQLAGVGGMAVGGALLSGSLLGGRYVWERAKDVYGEEAPRRADDASYSPPQASSDFSSPSQPSCDTSSPSSSSDGGSCGGGSSD